MATTKQVQILATYYHKTDGVKNGTVTYLVKSSDGKSTYCTTVVEGKATGCSCPAHKGCYHKKQLEAREQERREVATKFAAQSVPTWALQLVTAGKLVAPAKQVKVAKIIEQAVTAKVPAKDMMTASLTTNRGFSILR